MKGVKIMGYRYRKIITILFIGVFLFSVVVPVFSGTLHGNEWKKGKVTSVDKYSVGIDGWRHRVSDSVVIKDTSGEILPKDLKVLKGADEILYRMKEGKIVEIKIFKRRH